tara:strand:- start:140 stop:838 length:699 start_codon:yes stop_codon:yes gene_type:complete
MTKLGIVCGLAFEAAILEHAVQQAALANAPLIVCSGPGPDRARAGALNLTTQGAEALLSFGLAGGLDPELRTGTVITAESITGPEILSCDAAWVTRMTESLATDFIVRRAVLAASEDVLSTAEDKAALFRSSGAMAVDMESYGVAAAATEKGIPFAALRVICDTAQETIPPAASAAMTWEGRIRVTSTVFKALTYPAQIPDLVRLGRRTAAAKRVLENLAGLGVLGLFRAFG